MKLNASAKPYAAPTRVADHHGRDHAPRRRPATPHGIRFSHEPTNTTRAPTTPSATPIASARANRRPADGGALASSLLPAVSVLSWRTPMASGLPFANRGESFRTIRRKALDENDHESGFVIS